MQGKTIKVGCLKA